MTRKKQGQSEDLASSGNPPRNSPRASVRGFLFRGLFLGKNRVAGALALGLLVVWIWIGGALTIDESPRGMAAILRFLIHLPGPLAWMLSALGLGVAAVKILALERMRWIFSLAIGCAAMLFIDAAAGALGFLVCNSLVSQAARFLRQFFFYLESFRSGETSIPTGLLR